MYYLLRQLGADRRFAMLGAWVLGFNPFYLILAASFMTDIPYLALTIVALTLLLRGVDEGRTTTLVCGLALACLSILIRQIGLITLIGFMVAYPIRRGFGKRWLLLAFFPTVLSAGLLSLYERYLRSIGEMPGAYSSKGTMIKMFVLDVVHLHPGTIKWPARATIILAVYLGMCDFTVHIVACARSEWAARSRATESHLVVAGGRYGRGYRAAHNYRLDHADGPQPTQQLWHGPRYPSG